MSKVLTISFVVVFLAGATALGSWDPSMPAKYVQMPDLSPSGLDVMATTPKVLADDFPCYQTGLITDIHIWCSWRQDLAMTSDAVAFQLSIHDNIPAGPNQPYSKPGNLLWSHIFNPGEYETLIEGVAPEGWYNPNTGELVRNDHTLVWQYNFNIDPAVAFMQEGSAAALKIYWLDVSALLPPGQNAQFGWKTSNEHWMDDAVFTDTDVVGTSPVAGWLPLVDPATGQSLDMAFVITPEPATLGLLLVGGLALLRRGRK